MISLNIKKLMQDCRGFTLLEAMVSLGLFSLFMMIWFDNMSHQLTQLQKAHQQLIASEELLQSILSQKDTSQLVLIVTGESNAPSKEN